MDAENIFDENGWPSPSGFQTAVFMACVLVFWIYVQADFLDHKGAILIDIEDSGF